MKGGDSLRVRILASCLFILLSAGILVTVWVTSGETARGTAQDPAPVYITLWFDTEDYVLPQSDDAAKRVAEMLTRLNVKATFKVVGEKARTLERRGCFTELRKAVRRHAECDELVFDRLAVAHERAGRVEQLALGR